MTNLFAGPFVRSAALVVFSASAVCAQSPSPASTSAGRSLAFEDDIAPIFDTKCTSCHGGETAEEGLRLDSWSHLFAGADDGEAVIPFDSGRSLLIEIVTKLVAEVHPSEVSADTLTTEEVDSIRTWIDQGAQNKEGDIPFSDADNLLYVCNEGEATVSVIDMDANLVIRIVDLQKLGFSENAKPHHVAVEPNGEHWFVSLIGDEVVLKFNRKNELVGKAGFERPGLLVADPERDLLIVGRSMKAVNPPQRIGIIKRSTMEIEELDVFIARPHALALSADDRFLYTASLAANQVVTMNRETEQVDLYNIPGRVHTLVQFAVSPDGKTLVAGGEMTSEFLFFDISRPDAPELFDSVRVATAPWHPIYSRDGNFIYVGNKRANKVTVIDANARAVAAEISGRGISQPHGSALSQDGRLLYISNNNLAGAYHPRYDLGDNAAVGTVTVLDTSSKRIVKVIEVGANASGIGTRPVGS